MGVEFPERKRYVTLEWPLTLHRVPEPVFCPQVLLQKVEGLEIPFFAIEFAGGTLCDLTGSPRRVSVHYVCQEGGKGEIYELKETSTCEYEMVVLTSTLCSHPDYQ